MYHSYILNEKEVQNIPSNQVRVRGERGKVKTERGDYGARCFQCENEEMINIWNAWKVAESWKWENYSFHYYFHGKRHCA